jgi:hypothetical protein
MKTSGQPDTVCRSGSARARGRQHRDTTGQHDLMYPIDACRSEGSSMKTLIAILLALIAAPLLLFGGLVSLVYLGVAAAATWLWTTSLKLGPWRRPVALILLALVGVGLYLLQSSREVGRSLDSIASAPWPLHGSQTEDLPEAFRLANKAPQFDELRQLKDDFRRDVVRVRGQANSVERSLALKANADRLVAFAQAANLQIGEVISAKRAVDDALEKRGLDSGEKLKRQKAQLEEFLRTSEANLLKLESAEQAADFLTDFRLKVGRVAVDDVNDRTVQLEAAIAQVRKETVTSGVRVEVWYQATFAEARDVIIYDTIVAVVATKPILMTMDASELTLEHNPDAKEHLLLVAFGDDIEAAVPVRDPQAVSVPIGTTKVTFLRRTVIPARIQNLETPWRVGSFRSVLMKWPPPRPTKLRMLVDLSKQDGPESYPFAFELPTDSPIKSIRLPRNSLYMATIGLKSPRVQNDHDVFETDSPLAPSYFVTHNHVYLELMPDLLVYRNALVQKHKEFLVPENLAAAATAACLGAVAAILLP